MTFDPVPNVRIRPAPLLFRLAYALPRQCYFRACICLTKEERDYQKRVFKIARKWSKLLKEQN